MSHMIRIFVADDHDAVVRGIKDILDEHGDFEFVGTASNGVGLVEAILEARPDVVLLDVKMPDFDIFQTLDALVDLVEREKAFNGELPNIILVTSLLDPHLARKVYDLGVAGYLLKDDALSERLASTIRAVVAGGWAYSEAVQEVLKQPNGVRGRLTFGGNQFAVLCYMVDGYTPAQIAETIGCSIEAVHALQYRVRIKLGVETNEQAISKAVQERIVPLGHSRQLPG